MTGETAGWVTIIVIKERGRLGPQSGRVSIYSGVDVMVYIKP